MKTTGKVFLACGLGAFIGTMVALQLHRYLWWLGMLVGGLTGYLSYEFKKILKAIPEAFKSVCEWRFNPTGSPLFWKALMYAALVCYLLAFWIAAGITVVVVLMIAISSSPSFISFIETAEVFVSFNLAIGTIFLSYVIGDIICRKYLASLSSIEFSISNDRMVLLESNPYNVFKLLFNSFIPRCVAILFRIAIAIPKFLWKVSGKTGKFFKNLFILVHSDMRILCGLDAAIGTSFGYFFGNAIVGLFAGAILGVINYEIVSKRILHVNKVKSV